MSMQRILPTHTLRRSVLLLALLLALPMAAIAQTAPASSSSSDAMDMESMPDMDHSSMAGMSMPATSASTAKPATPKRKKQQARESAKPAKALNEVPRGNHDAMPGMDHHALPIAVPATSPATAPVTSGEVTGNSHDTMPDMDHGSMSDMTPQGQPAMSPDMQGMDHGAMDGVHPTATQGAEPMTGMTMGPMQGGSAPPNARSPDYSDGVGYGSMKGMDMADNGSLGMLLIDQLEAFHGNDSNGQTWEAQGWYGNDVNKVWIRTEGDRSRGKIEDGDVEAFWNRNVATYWSTQLGARHDLGAGPARNWAAFGVQGLAPYWFELEATAYVGQSGRTAARLRAEYELLLTQRLILQPEFEVNLYGKSDPATRIGSGLSDAQLGLRLRYEIRRQFAPYIGVVWTRRFGATADFARDDQQAIFDRQWVAGVRIWF